MPFLNCESWSYGHACWWWWLLSTVWTLVVSLKSQCLVWIILNPSACVCHSWRLARYCASSNRPNNTFELHSCGTKFLLKKTQLDNVWYFSPFPHSETFLVRLTCSLIQVLTFSSQLEPFGKRSSFLLSGPFPPQSAVHSK